MRWLVGVVLLAGCTVAVEDWGRVAGQARCERDQRCRGLSWSVDCTRPGVWPLSPVEQAALNSRQAGYSPSSAAACIERMRTSGCSTKVEKTVECRAAFPGMLSEGAACGQPLFDSCGSGLVCLRAESTSLCGTCATATPRGGEPNFLHPCDWGLRRVYDPDGGVVRCEARAKAGESCRSGDDCLEWLFCVQASVVSPGTCDEGESGQSRPSPEAISPPEVGQVCVSQPSYSTYGYQTCPSGLVCLNDACTALGALDAACVQDAECLSGRCLDGACAPPRGLGVPCSAENCVAGLGCTGDGDGGASCQPFECR